MLALAASRSIVEYKYDGGDIAPCSGIRDLACSWDQKRCYFLSTTCRSTTSGSCSHAATKEGRLLEDVAVTLRIKLTNAGCPNVATGGSDIQHG